MRAVVRPAEGPCDCARGPQAWSTPAVGCDRVRGLRNAPLAPPGRALYARPVMTETASSRRPDPAGRFALAALLAGAVAIGLSGILVRLSETGPVATGFYRIALALPVFVLWARLGRPRADDAPKGPAGVRANLGVVVLSGVLFAFDLAAFHWSLAFTTVANATLLSNLTPIWVTLGAWLLLGERIRPLFLIGLAVALGGSGVLMGRSFELGDERLFGDALAIVTSLFYGGYLLCVAHLRARLATPALMAASGAVTAALLLPAAVLSGETMLAHSAAGWAVLAGVALISQAGGQGLIAYALAHLPASFSSVSLLVQPVAAALFAWLILNEAVGPIQALGGAIVLAGIWIAARASLKRG